MNIFEMMLMEKVGESSIVSSDSEKAYDKVPREELWYCMRRSEVSETMLKQCRT